MSDRSPATLFIGNCKLTTDQLKKTLKEYEFKVQKAFCTNAETAIVSFNSPIEAQQCLSLIQQKSLFKGCTADFARKMGQKRKNQESRQTKKAKVEVGFSEDATKDQSIISKLENGEVDDISDTKKKEKKEKQKQRRADRIVKREERQAKELIVPRNENHIIFDENMEVVADNNTKSVENVNKRVVAAIFDENLAAPETLNEADNNGPVVNDAPEDGELDTFDPSHPRFDGMDAKKIRKQIKHEKGILRRKYRKEAKIAKREEEAAKPKPVLPPKNKAKYDFADRFVRKEMASKQKQKYPDPEDGTTLFIKYIPENTTKEALEDIFSKFGSLWYVALTSDSAFVNFKEKSACEQCLADYQKLSKYKNQHKDSILLEFNNDSDFSINGYVLDIVKAKSKKSISDMAKNRDMDKPKSTRRLDMLGEGLALSNEAAQYFSESNLEERLSLLKQSKDICAKDNEMEVSSNRVHLRNIPDDWDEHKLQIIVRAVMAKVILKSIEGSHSEYDLIQKSLNDLSNVVTRKVPWFNDWINIIMQEYYPTVEFKSELTVKLKKHFSNPSVPKKSRQNFKMRIPGFNCLYNQITIKKDLDGESKKFGFISFKDEYGAEIAIKFLTLLPVDKESGNGFVNYLKTNKGECKNSLYVSYALNNRRIIEIREQRKVQAKLDKRNEKIKKYLPQIEKKREELKSEMDRDYGSGRRY